MPSESNDDVVRYGEILASLDYDPSIEAGRDTFTRSFEDLQKTGDLDKSLDIDDFTKKVYPTLDGVPNSVTYDKNTKEFKEVK